MALLWFEAMNRFRSPSLNSGFWIAAGRFESVLSPENDLQIVPPAPKIHVFASVCRLHRPGWHHHLARPLAGLQAALTS